MSSYIFNFKKNKHIKLILLFLIIFFFINLFIYFIPNDYSANTYEDGISYKQDNPKNNYFVSDIKVVSFGDSKATQAFSSFFNYPALSLASPNNTIIFSKFIFDQLKTNTSFKPKVIILYVGPNNFNKNGIFTQRDYAIRQIASYNQLIEISQMDEGISYALDGLIAKLIPVYAKRVEIRHPTNFWKLITKDSEFRIKMPAMYNPGIVQKQSKHRDINKDKNYALIYERSVYNNYSSSKLHLNYLENFIKEIITLGAKPVIIQLPIDKTIYLLQDKLVRDEFKMDIKRLEKKYNLIHLNETKNDNYELLDSNHLSPYGHKNFIKEKINPILDRYIK